MPVAAQFWRGRCFAWFACLCGLAASAASGNPTEFHRELFSSWKALEHGFTYEMTFERDTLVIVKTTGEGAQRRMVGFAPAPAGLGARGRLRVTSAGETLHILGLDDPHGTSVLFRGDTISHLDSRGGWYRREPLTTSSEFNSISHYGFVFSPAYVSRHWLGEPWPVAWLYPGTAPTCSVMEKPAESTGRRAFEVTRAVRVEGKPDQIEHLAISYKRMEGLGVWVPTLIEQQTDDRQTMKRAVLEWVEVSDGGRTVAVPKRFLLDESARNPADGQFVPANRYVVTMDESTFRVRSRGAQAGVFAVLDAEPSPAMVPSKPPPHDTNRTYMMIFFCAVIAAAVLIGVRRLKKV